MPIRQQVALLIFAFPMIACAATNAGTVEAAAPVKKQERAQEQRQAASSDLTAANQHFSAGQWEQAIAAYDAALAVNDEQPGGWFRLGYALHASGNLERACVVHAKAAEYPALAPVALYNLGCAKALLGDHDAAFVALERAVQLGFNNASQLEGDPDLTSLHGDERWEALREHANGPDASSSTLRQMDFWIGDWTVASASGQVLGRNTITKQLNGNMIHEHWTGAGGDQGKSMNYWDRDAKEWHQLWVSDGGNVSRMAGNFSDGAMHFEGETMFRGGATLKLRTILTKLHDGRVHQHIEQSRDGGTTWNASFDGYYSKRAAQ